MFSRVLSTLAAGSFTILMLSGCALSGETKLTSLDQSDLSTEELVGREMTLTNDVEGIYGDWFLTMGDEKTVVFVKEMPQGISAGDEVEATGTVEEFEFTEADRERLYRYTSSDNANYLVNRDKEPVLTDATVKKAE